MEYTSEFVVPTNEGNLAADKIDILQRTAQIDDEWVNFVAGRVDDYFVRLIVQENASDWHYHSEGDELFLVIEGEYAVDFENSSVTLTPNQMLVVPKMVKHRTRAVRRSVVVCFESAANDIKGS